MRKILTLATLCTIILGCSSDIAQQIKVDVNKKYTARFDKEDTRVYLGEDYYFRWEQGDAVSLYLQDTINRKYQAAQGDIVISELIPAEDTDGPTAGEEFSYNYALYPYCDAQQNGYATYSQDEDFVLHAVLHQEQTYNAVHPNLQSAIMVSKIPWEDTEFKFRNSCALVKVNIKTTEAYADLLEVSSIEVGSRTSIMAGPVYIEAGKDDFTARIDNDAEGDFYNNVTLVGCETAGALTTEYKSFYVAIPAGSYQASDLTVSIRFSNNKYNYAAILSKAYDVKRSEYIELRTTIDPDKQNSFYEDTESGDINILNDATLVNKAIMADAYNLETQGFYNQNEVESILEIPDGDFTLNGNGKVFNFKATDTGLFVMNTFTTTLSGKNANWMQQNNVEQPPLITVNDITITGELRATCMGIYTAKWIDEDFDQGAFRTIFNNVSIVNPRIVSWTDWYGAALCTYGEATLNNCNIYGATRSELENPPIAPDLYDIAITNYSYATFNGGKYGKVRGWNHMGITVNNGAEVDFIEWNGVYNGNKTKNKITILNGTVHHLFVIYESTTYVPKVEISADAVIDILQFNSGVSFSQIYINTNATIGKILIGDTEMTKEEFLTNYNIKEYSAS